MEAEWVLGGGTADPLELPKPPRGLLTVAAEVNRASILKRLVASW
jgi:hypothetical protein